MLTFYQILTKNEHLTDVPRAQKERFLWELLFKELKIRNLLLMMSFIEKAREDGRKGLILTCKEELIPYYEQFGFENRGVSASVHGGSAWYDMVLTF